MTAQSYFLTVIVSVTISRESTEARALVPFFTKSIIANQPSLFEERYTIGSLRPIIANKPQESAIYIAHSDSLFGGQDTDCAL